MSKDEILDQIVVLLSGRAAEELVFNIKTTGAANDIERATELARDMVTRYGMSDLVGPVSYSSGNHEVFLGRDYNNMRNYSETVASEIDQEINRIVKESYSRCESILKNNTDKLHELAKYLIKHEKIDASDFEKLMKGELHDEALENNSEASDENSD